LRLLSLRLLCTAAVFLLAAATPGGLHAMDMNVHLNDGGLQTFVVEQVRKVTFDLNAPATMNVVMLAGNTTPVELTTVRSITFTGSLTAVSPRRARRIKAEVTNFVLRRLGAAATLSFTLNTPEQVTVSVLRLDGSVVRTLTYGMRPAGDHVLVWDGRDLNGRAAASGTYILRLDREHETRAFSFVTIR
jgi:hypothetical protein